MPVLDVKRTPDVDDFQPSLVLLIRDGFTGANILAGSVDVKIGEAAPQFQKQPEATFVFVHLANGKYTAQVRSAADQPYYLPADIPITLPLERPMQTPWPPQLQWPAYPNILLADPAKMLDDPEQLAAYLAQCELAALLPSTSYPFPEGATLVRGIVRKGGKPLSGALVTTALLAQAGQFPVVVMNPNGATSNAQTLAVVNAPVIAFLAPSTALEGVAFTLGVEGSGFASGSLVQLNGVTLPTTFVSAALLNAQVSSGQAAAAGPLPVVVTNPDGTVSNTQTLMVASAPVIASITPATVAAGSAGFALTVNGSLFEPGAVVQLNGAALPTTWVSEWQLSAQVAADQVAAVASLNMTMVNPGPPAQTSNSKILAAAGTPVIDLTNPTTVIAGSGVFTLVVEGSGFVSGATVAWGGVALPTKFVNPRELTAQVTAAQVAVVAQISIAVRNPNAKVSNAVALGVVAGPAISAIEPTRLATGSNSFTLVIRGSGFVPGAVVRLDQTDLPTTFLSSGRLDAHVKRSGYQTGDDGTFVLFFDNIRGRSQAVKLLASHPSVPKPSSQDVTVLRGDTVSVGIDMPS